MVVVVVVVVCSAVCAAPVAGAASTNADPVGGATVVGLTLERGAQLWESELGFPAIGTPPVSLGGRVYVVGEASCESATPTLVALDARDGRSAWRVSLPRLFELGGPRALVPTHGLLALAAFTDPQHALVEAVDARTGKVRWRVTRGREPSLADAGSALITWGFAASNAGVTLTGYDPASGRRLWHTTFPQAAEGPVPVAAVDGSVYVQSKSGMLSALDARSGEQRWQVESQGNLSGATRSLVLTGGKLLTARDARRGRERWQRSVDGESDFSAFATAGGNLYDLDTTHAQLTALDPQHGVVRWSNAHGGGSLLAASGAVALQSTAGLTVLDARDGHQRWTAPGALSGGSGDLPPAAVIANHAVYQVRPAARCNWGD